MAPRKNLLVLDGCTMHSACLGDITAREFAHLSSYAQRCLSSLLSSLIIHDEVIVGTDVIAARARFPQLFTTFGDALIERSIAPVAKEPELESLYLELKRRFAALGRPEPYEDAISGFAEKHFFGSSEEPEPERLRKADPELFPIFDEHSLLRTRMYNLQASELGVAYTPSPYRTRFCTSRECQGLIAEDILRNFARDVRRPLEGDIQAEWSALPFSLDLPPLVHFILNESRGCSLFETAAEIRRSKGAHDFRVLCAHLFNERKLSNVASLLREMRELREHWRTELFPGALGMRDIPVQILRLDLNQQIPSADQVTGPVKLRQAYIFLFNVMNAQWRDGE